jgi:hypothetical protein
MVTPRRSALETPYAKDHERSMENRLAKGRMPKDLRGLLRWYAQEWDMEVPDALHKVEVWYGRDREVDGTVWPRNLTGGSLLGTHAWHDRFRRYLENMDSEVDEDGYYKRPVHAALARLGRRWPITAQFLFYVAQSGYDWRGVAERVHWAEEPFCVFLEEALRKLWREYAEQKVRLE